MKIGRTQEKCKYLFTIIANKGEYLGNGIHIIETTEYPQAAEERKFRVYSNKGYCFDVFKEIETENEETGEIEYYYDIYCEWDGFEKITVKEAIQLIDSINKLI